MSDWERTATFDDDFTWGGAFKSKLELQDTADTYSYSVNGVHQWTMGISEMTALFNMIHSMPYPECPDEEDD